MTTSADDEAAIVAVSLDYFEGWFEGDVARMDEAPASGACETFARDR